MARITVEDCLDHVDNRFQLVMVASKRARQLMVGGKEPNLEWENDKATVMALREIEEGFVTPEILLEEDVREPLFEEEIGDLSALTDALIAESNAAVASESAAAPEATPAAEESQPPSSNEE